MTWISQHKLLFIIIIAIIVIGVGYGLSQSSAPEPLLTTTTVEGTLSTNSDQEIIGTLLSLRAVSLSGSIFSDPAFLTLLDFGTTIVPEPVGRPNPFAPLGAQAASVSANPGTSRDDQIFTPRR